jgi:hypothetical protein
VRTAVSVCSSTVAVDPRCVQTVADGSKVDSHVLLLLHINISYKVLRSVTACTVTHLNGQISEQSSAVDAADSSGHKDSCEHSCDVIVKNFKGALVPLFLSKFFDLQADS